MVTTGNTCLGEFTPVQAWGRLAHTIWAVRTRELIYEPTMRDRTAGWMELMVRVAWPEFALLAAQPGELCLLPGIAWQQETLDRTVTDGTGMCGGVSWQLPQCVLSGWRPGGQARSPLWAVEAGHSLGITRGLVAFALWLQLLPWWTHCILKINQYLQTST